MDAVRVEVVVDANKHFAGLLVGVGYDSNHQLRDVHLVLFLHSCVVLRVRVSILTTPDQLND